MADPVGSVIGLIVFIAVLVFLYKLAKLGIMNPPTENKIDIPEKPEWVWKSKTREYKDNFEK